MIEYIRSFPAWQLYTAFGLFYLFMMAFIYHIVYGMNFIREFVSSLITGSPIDSDDVLDLDDIDCDSDLRVMARVMWFITFTWYFIHMILKIVLSFGSINFYRNKKLPKWLTIYGLVEYSNRILGHGKK